MFFYSCVVPGATHIRCGLQPEPVMRRAHVHFRREPAFKKICVGENRNVPGLTCTHSKGMLEARSCHTLLSTPVGTLPKGNPAPLISRFIRAPVAPVHSRRLQSSNPRGRPSSQSNAKSPGGRLMGIRCRGLGEFCARQTCRYEGQTAAHGQITERKPSVAHLRFSFLSHERGVPGPEGVLPAGAPRKLQFPIALGFQR